MRRVPPQAVDGNKIEFVDIIFQEMS